MLPRSCFRRFGIHPQQQPAIELVDTTKAIVTALGNEDISLIQISRHWRQRSKRSLLNCCAHAALLLTLRQEHTTEAETSLLAAS